MAVAARSLPSLEEGQKQTLRRIADEIVIDLPRPRPVHLGHSPEFVGYADRIYAIFETLGIYSST